MTTFKGSTGDMAPILGARFWSKGRKIAGTILGSFSTKNGICFQILLLKPMRVKSSELSQPLPDGQKEMDAAVVSVGNMKGFEQAVTRSGAVQLQPKDNVVIECTGERETGQESAMILFDVEVDRPDKAS